MPQDSSELQTCLIPDVSYSKSPIHQQTRTVFPAVLHWPQTSPIAARLSGPADQTALKRYYKSFYRSGTEYAHQNDG